MRILGQYDLWHILEDFTKKTYFRTNTHVKRLESAVAYRAFCGPWNKHAFWHRFVGASKILFTLGADNTYYSACYNRICDDRCIPQETRMEGGHRAQLWANLPNSRVFQKLGFQPVLGRWCNHEEKHIQLKPDRAVILMVTLFMGIEKRWWPSLRCSPLHHVCPELHTDPESSDGDERKKDDADPNSGLEEPEAAAPAAAAASTSSPSSRKPSVAQAKAVLPKKRGKRDADPNSGLEEPEAAAPAAAPSTSGSSSRKPSVAQAKAMLSKKRGKRANTLDFACHWYANADGLQDLDAVAFINDPVVEYFRMWLSRHKAV